MPCTSPLINRSRYFTVTTLFIQAQPSLMRLRRVAFQAVDHASLGRPQIDPCVTELLESDEELRAAFLRLVVHLVTVLELDLIRELADERPVLTACAP